VPARFHPSENPFFVHTPPRSDHASGGKGPNVGGEKSVAEAKRINAFFFLWGGKEVGHRGVLRGSAGGIGGDPMTLSLYGSDNQEGKIQKGGREGGITFLSGCERARITTSLWTQEGSSRQSTRNFLLWEEKGKKKADRSAAHLLELCKTKSSYVVALKRS